MKKILEEFKAFALKGNMIDMAVAVIIGGAFNSLITSLVENVVMPALSLITGKIDFSNMFLALNGEHYATLEAAKEQTSVVAYGLFVTQLIKFPDHGLCCVPCYPPVKQAVQETGSACKADGKRMPVLQNKDCHRGNPLPALHLHSF